MIRIFDSIAALRREAIVLNSGHGTPGGSWYNNETRAMILERSLIGNTALVPQAEALMSQLETQIETQRRTFAPSMAGLFCVVPDVLAGRPTPMRRIVHVPDDRAPITILVDMGSSAQIPAAVMLKRGIAILALTMAIAALRPISLYYLDCGDGPRDKSGETVMCCRIDTAPLDLATACYVLSSAGFTRWMVYGLEEKLNGMRGGWPRDYSLSNPHPYYNKLIPRLGFDPAHTIIIPAARITDPAVVNPVPWLNAQIANLVNVQEDLENV